MKAIEAVEKIKLYDKMERPLYDMFSEFKTVRPDKLTLSSEERKKFQTIFRDKYNFELDDFSLMYMML